jgi:hypothetical protein
LRSEFNLEIHFRRGKFRCFEEPKKSHTDK